MLCRCTNADCARPDRDFDAADAVCAACGKPALELVPVHYVPPDPRRANRRLMVPLCGCRQSAIGLPHTGELTAVTCLKCKEVLANG